MKKTIVFSLFMLSLVFFGCSKSNAGRQMNLIMATGGTSGTYYSFGGALAQVLSSSLEGVSINVQSTGASVANLRLVSTNDADLAIVQNDVMSYAYTGTENFEKNSITKFKPIATLYPEVCQIVASASSGIKTVYDMKGKRISVGDIGSGTEANARQILSEYGIEFSDITVQNLGFGDSATALKDGKIDAAFVTAGIPTTAVMELATTNDIVLVPVDPDQASNIIAKYPFYVYVDIPADTYRGVPETIHTLAVKATLIASPSLDDKLVYSITKTLFDRQNDLAVSHAKGKELNVENAVQGISVPMHSGAEKYYREIGLVE